MANIKPPPTIRQVLLLDGDHGFLRMAKTTLGALSAGCWEIHCAATPDAALDLLSRRKMDLAILDSNLPVLDGVQVLKLLAGRFPELKKVCYAVSPGAEKRADCLEAGAHMFLEKPRSREEFKSVFALMNDLLSQAPQPGFQGMLRRVGLTDVIQMECLGRNSSVLEVYNEHVMGRIYIENGNIIHAVGGDLTGERALNHLLSLPHGSFELVPFEMPPENSISGPWEFLLMEAARVRDEMTAQTPPSGEPKVNAETLTVSNEITVRVAEALVCAGDGRVLCQENDADRARRLGLLQAVSRQVEQMAAALALGSFDRVEWKLEDGRAIAQTRPDRMVFIRVINLS